MNKRRKKGTGRKRASGGQGDLLKNRPLDPYKTFY
jgi:hypothetical protein